MLLPNLLRTPLPLWRLLLTALLLVLCLGCTPPADTSTTPSAPQVVSLPADLSNTLVEARSKFKTNITVLKPTGDAPPEPPPEIGTLVHYPAPPGPLAAYLTPIPEAGKRHPAIVWISGGDCNNIGPSLLQYSGEGIDESVSGFREAGVITMFPSLRGGNDNLGIVEGFYGEVDDVLAAADYLAAQDFVDPQRIYLGGHSTGGTMALLAAECGTRFRATFAFGPTNKITDYGAEQLPFDIKDPQEVNLRSPGQWLHCLHHPVFLLEGDLPPSRVAPLYVMKTYGPKTNYLQVFMVTGANHFTVLGPVSKLIGQKIQQDNGEQTNIRLSHAELDALFAK